MSCGCVSQGMLQLEQVERVEMFILLYLHLHSLRYLGNIFQLDVRWWSDFIFLFYVVVFQRWKGFTRNEKQNGNNT